MPKRAFKFPNAFQHKTLAAGENARVYVFDVPAGAVAFIESVGVTVPNENSYYRWRVDGDPVEEDKVTFQVGQVRSPTRYDPPIVAHRKIEFWAYNDGSSEEIFEVLCDGHYVTKEGRL